MNAKLTTKKNADGTYSWKLVTEDYPGTWNKTQARTPWGARVQGAPYLKFELDAIEWMRTKGQTFGQGWVPSDLMLEG
jgi:hypothetical protein